MMQKSLLPLLILAGCAVPTVENPAYTLTASLSKDTIDPPDTIDCVMDWTGGTLPAKSRCTVRSATAFEKVSCQSSVPVGNVFTCTLRFGSVYGPTGSSYTTGAWEVEAVTAFDSGGVNRLAVYGADLVTDGQDVTFQNCVPATDCNGGAWECGTPPDGCSGVQSCGSCAGGETCNPSTYVCESETMPASTIYAGSGVDDGKLFDACGNEFVPMGVNVHGMIGSFSQAEYGAGGAPGIGENNYDLQGTVYAEVAKTGANTVQIPWITPAGASNNADSCYNHPNDGSCPGGHNEQGDFTGGGFNLTGPGSLDTQVQAAIDAGLFPWIKMYDPIGPDNWGDPTDTTPSAETVTFTADTAYTVQITGTGLPALAVDDVIYIGSHTTHDGLYKVTTVNTSTSDYLVKSISGAVSSAGAEAVDFHVPSGNFEETIKWLETQPVRDFFNGLDDDSVARSEYIILEYAIEAGPGLGAPYTEYITANEWAITRLRLCDNPSTDPCFEFPLVVSADDWGSDEGSLTLAAGSGAWLAADPYDNLIYDWHNYAALDRAAYQSVFTTLVGTGQPAVVGEFGSFTPFSTPTDPPTNCVGKTSTLPRVLTEEAAVYGFGAFPWAWGDDAATGLAGHYWNDDFDLGCWELDMTEFETCASLEREGCDLVVNDPNGVTARGSRPGYLDDRCGNIPAWHAAPGSCGDTCANQSGFNCTDATVYDYTTSAWFAGDQQDAASSALTFSIWVNPRDITNPDQGLWVGPALGGGGAPTTWAETSMRVRFTGAASTVTVEVLDGAGAVGTPDTDTWGCDAACPVINQRQWHRFDFVADLTTNTYDVYMVEDCDPMDTPLQIATGFNFSTDSSAVNDPPTLDYWGAWGASTGTANFRMKYPEWATTCTPDCAGRECGSDGCGGTCAPGCSGGEVCDGTGTCQATGTLAVDVTTYTPPGACSGQLSWTITDSLDNVVQTGTGSWSDSAAPVGDYTITWGDSAYACTPPEFGGDNAETRTLTSGGSAVFDLGPDPNTENYELRTTRQLAVDVQEDGGACSNCPWEVAAASPWTSSDFYDSGTVDEDPIVGGTGTVRDGRDYTVTYSARSGFTTPTADTLTAQSAKQTATGNWTTIAGTVLFADTIQSASCDGSNYGFSEFCSESPINDNCEQTSCSTTGEAAAGLEVCTLESDCDDLTVPVDGSGTCIGCVGGSKALQMTINPNVAGGARAQVGHWDSGATGGAREVAINGGTIFVSSEMYFPQQPVMNNREYPWGSVYDIHFTNQWTGGWAVFMYANGIPSSAGNDGKVHFNPNNAPGTNWSGGAIASTAMPNDEWFCLEWETDFKSNATGETALYLNGTEILRESNVVTKPGSPNMFENYWKFYSDKNGGTLIPTSPVQLYRRNMRITDYKTDCQ